MLIDLLLQFGLPCPAGEICWTDINADCSTDVLDQVAVLLAFGATCPTNPGGESAGASGGGGIESEPWFDGLLAVYGLSDLAELCTWLAECDEDEAIAFANLMLAIVSAQE